MIFENIQSGVEYVILNTFKKNHDYPILLKDWLMANLLSPKIVTVPHRKNATVTQQIARVRYTEINLLQINLENIIVDTSITRLLYSVT